MTLQHLAVEISEPIPGKLLGNCSICPWELWSNDANVLQHAWEQHARQKHGNTGRQGRLA